MNPSSSIWSFPLIKALGWTLVQFLWQGVLVWLFFEGVRICLKGAKPGFRYIAACIALFSLSIIFVSTLYSSWKILDQYQPFQESQLVYISSSLGKDGFPPHNNSNTGSITSIASPSPKKGSFFTILSSHTLTIRTLSILEAWLPFLILGWVSGVGFLLFRLGIGLWHIKKLAHRLISPVSKKWKKSLEIIMKKMSMSKPVRIVESGLARVPTVIGWLRPVILIPTSVMTGLSREQLEAILAHELAHIKRYDHLVNVFQVIMETVFYYHPVVWRISHRIRAEREQCCDELAVAACGSANLYARALSSLEEIRTPSPRIALAARDGSLLTRIKRIIIPPAYSPYHSYRWLTPFLVIAQILMLGIFYQFSLFALQMHTNAGISGAKEKSASGIVRIAISQNGLFYQGRKLSLEQLSDLLREFPNPGNKIIALSATSDDISLKQLVDSAQLVQSFANNIEFQSMSYAGVLSANSSHLSYIADFPPEFLLEKLKKPELNLNEEEANAANREKTDISFKIPEIHDSENTTGEEKQEKINPDSVEKQLYSFLFDNPDEEGWEPIPIAPGTYVDNVMAPVPVYVAPTVTANSRIGIVNTEKETVFGTWQMKADAPLQELEGGYIYKVSYQLNTDQEDSSKVPLTRLRWSDASGVSSSSFFVDRGPNAPGTISSEYDCFFFKSPDENALGTNHLLYMDMIDLTSEQEGSLFCEEVEVSRLSAPDQGTLLTSLQLSEDYMGWNYFYTSKMDTIDFGTDEKGIWLESPGPPGDKEVHFGGYGTLLDSEGITFQPGCLYQAVFTLCCESDEARKHLPMIRIRFGNGTSEWIASREIRQIQDLYSHMPTSEGKQYSVYLPSPPYLSGEPNENSDKMTFNFDIIDGYESEYGRVYLKTVEVYEYPFAD